MLEDGITGFTNTPEDALADRDINRAQIREQTPILHELRQYLDNFSFNLRSNHPIFYNGLYFMASLFS